MEHEGMEMPGAGRRCCTRTQRKWEKLEDRESAGGTARAKALRWEQHRVGGTEKGW